MSVPWYRLRNGRKKRVSEVANTVPQSQTMCTEALSIFRLVCPGPRNEWLSPPGLDSINSMCAITHWACTLICSLRVPSKADLASEMNLDFY